MEEKNMNNKIGVGIIIGLLISLVIGLSGFIVYDKFINNDKKGDNQTTLETNTPSPTTTPSNQSETNKLDYKIIGEEGNKQIIVNGKTSSITGAINIEVIGIINDVIVVAAGYVGSERYVVLDKNANAILEITGKGAVGNNLSNNVLYLKGNIPNKVIVDGNSIVATSYISQDPKYSSCNSLDDEVVEYKEKIEYKNGQFSDATVLSTISAKDYRQTNNIKCQ